MYSFLISNYGLFNITKFLWFEKIQPLLGQKFVKFSRWRFGKSKTSKSHSEINWPLEQKQKFKNAFHHLMAFMISVVHNFVNNDCTTPKKQKLRNEINWNEIKWIFNSQKKPITATEKKTVVKIWNEKWFEKKNHHHSTIQPFFDTTKKMNNNEKKWIVIQFGLKYLKRTSLCTWKVHIPFLSTTLQNTAQSRAKNAFFASKIKKVVKQLLAKMILKKQKTFWFSSNKYTNLPPFPSNVGVHIFA